MTSSYNYTNESTIILLYHIFQEMQAAITMRAGPLQLDCPSPYTHFQSLRHDTGRTFYKQNR